MGDIFNGYSIYTHSTLGEVYIKHLDYALSAKISSFTDRTFNRAKNEKVPTEEERLAAIILDKLWGKEEEKQIKDLNLLINGMKLTRSKLPLKSAADEMTITIKQKEEELFKLESKKRELLGVTAESYAQKKASEYYLYNAAYKDANLKDFLLTNDEYDDLDEGARRELFHLFDLYAVEMGVETIKKVAVSQYFMKIYMAAGDNIYHLYGQPVKNLTFNQLDLWELGNTYKNILIDSKYNIPPEMEGDYEKILTWYDTQRNINAMVSQGGENRSVSIVGATKEDMKAIDLANSGPGTINLAEAAAKKGGSLSMSDLLRLEYGEGLQ